ncbi:MAG: hypothetical protein FJW44_05855 [Actinobacteria bacterium]|nr:hypothetical protein [Actinomycetota bacterium]
MALLACGGGASSTVSREVDTMLDAPDIDFETSCGGASLADLGSEPLCADSGLRAEQSLSISNWGGYIYPDDDFGVDEMVALFGSDAVCVTYENGQCDERADAALRREELNSMISGGRCEGLTTLASRLDLTLSTPSAVGGVQAVANLAPTITGVVDVIDYWWATQFNETVIEQTAETREDDLESLVKLLIQGLRKGAGFTMGIYFEMMGHSILPVAVTSPSERKYTVWVWDSNDPSRLLPLTIDVEVGKWSYENASANPQIPGVEWSGEKGTIDLTPMASRDVADKVRFKGEGSGKVRVSVVPIGKGTADLLVSVPDGRSAGTADGVVVADIPGAIVQLHRDGLSNGLTVLLPKGVVNFGVDVKTSSVEEGGDAIITVAKSGGRTTRVKAKAKAGSTSSRVVLEFEESLGEVTVTPSDESSAVVTVGEKRLSVEIPIEQGESLQTSAQPRGEEGVDINLRRGEESILEESVAPAPTATEKVSFVPRTLTKTVEVVSPKQVADASAIAEKVAKLSTNFAGTTTSIAPTSAKTASSTEPKLTTTTVASVLAPATTVKSTVTTVTTIQSTVKPTVKPTVTTVKSTLTTVKPTVSSTSVGLPSTSMVKSPSTTLKVTSTTLSKSTTTTAMSIVAPSTTVKPRVTTVKSTSTTVKPPVTSTSVGMPSTSIVKSPSTTLKVTSTTLSKSTTTTAMSIVAPSTTVKPTVTTVKPTLVPVTTIKSPTTTTKPVAATSTTTIATESAPVATSAPTSTTSQVAVPAQTTIAPTTSVKSSTTTTPKTTTTIKK